MQFCFYAWRTGSRNGKREQDCPILSKAAGRLSEKYLFRERAEKVVAVWAKKTKGTGEVCYPDWRRADSLLAKFTHSHGLCSKCKVLGWTVTYIFWNRLKEASADLSGKDAQLVRLLYFEEVTVREAEVIFDAVGRWQRSIGRGYWKNWDGKSVTCRFGDYGGMVYSVNVLWSVLLLYF